ncbi:hypothetical protein ABPG74_014474 [Tetrahymena malaccensis]
MNWPSSSNKSRLNNNSGGNILKGSQSGVKNRTPLPPIKDPSKKSQELKTAQNTQTNLQLGGQSEGLIRNYKEEGQIEMAGIDNDSSSHEEQNVINSKQGSYISANSTERRDYHSQKPDNFTKIHKILSKCICSGAVFWLYMIFIFIFGIITISVCGSASTELSKLKDSEAYLYSQETLNLWHNRLIMDIITNKGQTCPQNYEQALNYQWSGTLQGCACPYTSQNMQQIFLVKGKCNSELLSYNCYDVDPTAPQFINTWKNGQLICIQRHPSQSFFNSPTSCNSNNPSSNLRACGTGQTAICVPSTQNCPVSYIQSQNNDNIVGNTQIQILQIDNTVSLSFEKQSSHYPVSQFRIDEYSHCQHITEQQISPTKRGDYVLLNNRRQFCSQNDTRPIILDSIGEEALFRNNPQLWQLLMQSQQLPAYPRPSNTFSWILSSMPYPTWSMSCRDSSKYSLSVAQEKFDIDSEEYNQVHLIITTSISLFMVSLVLVIIEIWRKFVRQGEIRYYKTQRFEDSRFKSNRFDRILYPRERGWVRNTYIITALHWIFRILNLPSIFIAYLQVQDSINWFDNAVGYQCGDTFFQNNIAHDYSNYLKQLKQFYAVMLSFWWVLFFIDIFYFIFNFFYEILPAKEEEFQTDLIVVGGDKHEIIPIMHKNNPVAPPQQPVSIQHIQQQPIIQEEVDDEHLFDDERKK